MFYFKTTLLLAAMGCVILLGLSFAWNLMAALQAPYVWKAMGQVVEILPPPAGDADRVPPSGSQVVVEFTDAATGKLKREAFNQYNSGGATVFHNRSVGDTVEFEVRSESPVPGAEKTHAWGNVGKVALILGGSVAGIGALILLF
jgi:hypothetical protein